jgi:Xaa-Pro aminopeptidase
VLFALQQAGISVVDGQQVFLNARRIKTGDEIALLTQAASMVDAAYEELYTFLRPGVRENEAVGLVSKVLYDLGSEYVEGVNAISGERCSPHPHVFSDRLIRPGDPAFFDILHSHQGYRTCYYRTFAVGSASSAQRDAYRIAREYMDRAIALVKPGATTADIVSVWPTAQEFGFPDEEAAFALQYGHGVGLSIWEKPIFSRLVSLDHPEVLEEGMVFALETYWPSADGIGAARIEEELVVTATGCEVITKFPAEDLLVAGQRYFAVGGPLGLERNSQSHLNTRAGRGEIAG